MLLVARIIPDAFDDKLNLCAKGEISIFKVQTVSREGQIARWPNVVKNSVPSFSRNIDNHIYHSVSFLHGILISQTSYLQSDRSLTICVLS